jgi:hypothetical protein
MKLHAARCFEGLLHAVNFAAFDALIFSAAPVAGYGRCGR